MSQSDRSSTISENESKDRSLTEWNFSNPKKYMLKSNKDNVLDVNDVEFELFRSEKLPYKYGVSRGLPNYQRKCNVKSKAFMVTENDSPSTHCDENLNDSFVSSISNIVLKDVPLVNSRKSYTTISNDQKAMSNSLSKTKSSHALYSENVINQNAAPKRSNSFNKNAQQIPKDKNVDNLTVEKNGNIIFKSSQGMKYPLNEVSQDKNSDMVFLQSNEINNQKVKGIRKCHSTLNLKDPNADQIPKLTESKSPSQPSISKSLSLNNLASSRNLNYDHIQSKVKWYIQERKRHERRQSKSCESRSLPVTPVKGKTDNFDTKGLLKLDEEYLENLCISSKKQRDDLPDDLKQLKEKFLTENVDKNLVEIIFNRLKIEREGRIDKDIILNALQLHYDDLLVKYSEAKNLIDDLRFYKDEQSEKKDDFNTDKYPNFKKAYSTSNIFQECSSSSAYDINARPFSSNLVRYSSSPLVDPDIIQNLMENDEDEERPLNLNSLSKRSYSTLTLNTSFRNDFSEWFEKYDHLNQRLKEFIILEANSALNKDEREQILNFIIKNLSELETEYQSFDHCSSSEDCRRKLEEIKEVIEDVNNKYSIDIPTFKYDNVKEEKFLSSSGAGFITLPSNSSYSNVVDRGVIDTPFDSSSKLFDSSSKCQLTSTTIYPTDKPKTSFLKYSHQRDADSGCPPSDRSTRNSQFPSFEQSESLTTNATGPEAPSRLGLAFRRSMRSNTEDLMRRKSLDSFLNLSSINLGIEDSHKRRLYNRKDYRYRSLHTFDEDYDASASSDLEDSYGEERSKKCVKKRLSKSNRSPSVGLNKFEDKFICNHRLRAADPRSTKYETNKHLLGMSQMEKNSKYFEVQVKDLKLKGLLRKRVDKKRYSIPSRPNTPLKALSKDNLSLINMSDLSISSTPGTPGDINQGQVGNGKRSSVSLMNLNPRDQTRVNECTPCVHCSFPVDSVPTCSHRKFSTSTPKSHDSEVTMCDSGLCKEPISASSFASNERNKIAKRSVSLSSLCSLDKMEIANPTGLSIYAPQHSQAECQISCCCHSYTVQEPKSNLMPPRYKKNKSINESYKNEYSRFIRCLNEATDLAEGIRSRTQARNFLHLNMLPSTTHR